MKDILFFDFDGTLVETASGKLFPESKEDMVVKVPVLESIKKMHSQHPLSYIFIISNQGGVSTGYHTNEDVEWRFKKVIDTISSFMDDPSIKYQYDYCPSIDPADPMRKPNPGMVYYLLQFVEGEDLDLIIDRSLMIGDASGKPGQWSDSDRRTAEICGMDYMDVEDFMR